MNFSMMIGLAVGIDYSLFIVSRYREEREDGNEPLDAIANTLDHRRQGRVPVRPHRRALARRGVPRAGHGVPLHGARHDPRRRGHRRRLAHPAAGAPRRPRRPGPGHQGQGPRPRRRRPLGPLDRPRPEAARPHPRRRPRRCCSPSPRPALGMRLGMPGARVVDTGPVEPRRLRPGHRGVRARRRRADLHHRPRRDAAAGHRHRPAPTPTWPTPGIGAPAGRHRPGRRAGHPQDRRRRPGHLRPRRPAPHRPRHHGARRPRRRARRRRTTTSPPRSPAPHRSPSG